ncbi:MAG TPA: molybdenum cofactor guanylyltransferase [Candidatus Baltobacteraceae bacterium]|nr:molybdenum cofactor guanylyltransferase [Candidatus Baltobacteraceae bacterium]
MARSDAPLGVVILAGGEASRLPHKLELPAGGVPLVLRVYRGVRDVGPVWICASGTFPEQIDCELDCPVIVDRWPRRGPLAALYHALPYVRAKRVFVVAADAPYVDGGVAAELASAWEPEIEAVVPLNRHDRLEPLCALYDRAALLNAARAVLSQGSGGVAAAVECLAAKRVQLSNERVFWSVNTPADWNLLKA